MTAGVNLRDPRTRRRFSKDFQEVLDMAERDGWQAKWVRKGTGLMLTKPGESKAIHVPTGKTSDGNVAKRLTQTLQREKGKEEPVLDEVSESLQEVSDHFAEREPTPARLGLRPYMSTLSAGAGQVYESLRIQEVFDTETGQVEAYQCADCDWQADKPRSVSSHSTRAHPELEEDTYEARRARSYTDRERVSATVRKTRAETKLERIRKILGTPEETVLEEENRELKEQLESERKRANGLQERLDTFMSLLREEDK